MWDMQLWHSNHRGAYCSHMHLFLYALTSPDNRAVVNVLAMQLLLRHLSVVNNHKKFNYSSVTSLLLSAHSFMPRPIINLICADVSHHCVPASADGSLDVIAAGSCKRHSTCITTDLCPSGARKFFLTCASSCAPPVLKRCLSSSDIL